MTQCADAWAMLNFEEHVRGMAARDNTQSGKCTIAILNYMVCGHGVDDLLRNFFGMQLFCNPHGVALDIDGTNAYMHKAAQTGEYGNKSDKCDIMWMFTVWLQAARQTLTDLRGLQNLAKKHGRNIYLEFRVMGGGEENAKQANLCSQWCIDVLLQYLCRDVQLPIDALLVSGDSGT